MYPLDDTIVAVASPPGGAARGIVRLSGPAIFDCLAAIGARRVRGEQPSAPHVIACSLLLPELFSELPCEIYCWPRRGYTGQPCAEIHTLGSPPLLQIVVRALCEAGARLAEPGEFTLRAFLAGRIDLTQAEAVLGVIDADDSAALAVALEQLAGGLARPLHRLCDDLVDLLAHLEAGFDFADEDLPFISRKELRRRLADAETAAANLLRQMSTRGESSESVQAVLIGRPNAGKSSLFNALAGDAAALVSHCPGTTRDYLAAELDFDGIKCRLIDTAGVGEPLAEENAADRAAQSFAASQHRSARIQVLCLDSTRPLDDWLCGLLREADNRRIVVLTKCDAPRGIEVSVDAIETSSRTGQGIHALRDALRRKNLAAGAPGDMVASTAARCRESLRLAEESLQRAKTVAATGQEELAAAEIRAALDEIGRVTGAVYTEDVLSRVFSRFCVGK